MSFFAGIASVAQGIFAISAGRAQNAHNREMARQRELQAVAEANDRARQGRAALGTGAAIAGASGFTTGGSASDVLRWMAQRSQTSADRARIDGYRDADNLRYRGQQAQSAGYAQATVSFLNAAGEFSDMGG